MVRHTFLRTPPPENDYMTFHLSQKPVFSVAFLSPKPNDFYFPQENKLARLVLTEAGFVFR
jgi:hypothetical protein